jgi:Spy/CpxP family protein refolding chaperone
MKNSVMVIALTLGMSAFAQQPGGQPGQIPGAQAGSIVGSPGYHLFAPRFQERLKLSPEQETQVSALDVDVKSKLGNILTAEQFQQLNRTHPPRPQNSSAGGQGGTASGPDDQSVSGGQGGPGISAEKRANAKPADPLPPLTQDGVNTPSAKTRGFHLLSPRTRELLALNDDQQKQVTALEMEVKGKLNTILTPEQLNQLAQMRPSHEPADNGSSAPQPGSANTSAATPNAGATPERP